MMDLTSIIEIAVVIAIVYFLIKFIVSPIIKALVGIATLIILVSILQRFFGFNLDQVLAPFGISFNSSKWGLNLDWFLNPINYYLNKGASFFHLFWENVPKK